MVARGKILEIIFKYPRATKVLTDSIMLVWLFFIIAGFVGLNRGDTGGWWVIFGSCLIFCPWYILVRLSHADIIITETTISARMFGIVWVIVKWSDIDEIVIMRWGSTSYSKTGDEIRFRTSKTHSRVFQWVVSIKSDAPFYREAFLIIPTMASKYNININYL